MATFGIVAEGITDQAVIENILLGYFDGQEEEPVVNPVQPLVDRKQRVLLREGRRNPSLALFLGNLDALTATRAAPVPPPPPSD